MSTLRYALEKLCDYTESEVADNPAHVGRTPIASITVGDLRGLLMLHGDPRDEATVKAEALREAATAAREDAANSRTPQGHAEATTYADWLDDRATEIDPARLEGAHP